MTWPNCLIFVPAVKRRSFMLKVVAEEFLGHTPTGQNASPVTTPFEIESNTMFRFHFSVSAMHFKGPSGLPLFWIVVRQGTVADAWKIEPVPPFQEMWLIQVAVPCLARPW